MAREGHLPGCRELQRLQCEARPLQSRVRVPCPAYTHRPTPACACGPSPGARPRPRLGAEAVQGLEDPSPRAPLAPPEAARTPEPGGGEGASSRQCPSWGLGLTGRGPHREVRALCQAAARLGCGGWAHRGGRPAAFPRRGHGWAGSAQEGNPTRPGSR